MGKSDETHRCDVQKIAEEKYITQKAASKRAVIIFITAFLIVGIVIIGIVYYLLSVKFISSNMGRTLGSVEIKIEDKPQVETDGNNVFVNNIKLYQYEEEKELDLYPFVDEEGRYGYIDSSGEVIIEPQYGYANFFSEGMAFVVIDEKGAYINEKGEVISGLFASGEVTGGIHGANRLGGTAVTDIIVFGQIAGENAADFAK